MYRTLLIDPPTRFEVYSRATGLSRSAEAHYPTMTWEELAALPVPLVVARNACVFMWSTFPNYLQTIALGEAWGLTYITAAFVWAKTNKSLSVVRSYPNDEKNWFMGMGYWTRANAEPCLLFTKGSPKRAGKGVRQLLVSAVREHSEKPGVIHDRIERLVEGPYLELFGRKEVKGWTVIGNEVTGRDIREDLQLLARGQ